MSPACEICPWEEGKAEDEVCAPLPESPGQVFGGRRLTPMSFDHKSQ